VIDSQVARDFAQALSFRREVAAQQPALAQFLQARPPAFRGAAEPFEEHRQFG
jgi:hypothetical protein